jgi:hypothetical protein
MKYLVENMEGHSRDASPGISDIRVAAVLIFVILNIAVFFERLVSVLRYGALFPFDSVQPIYAVWKGVHHLQVYEWPLAYPFSLALYNYLFYYTYAIFLRTAGATGADIMTWGRMFTPVFAIVGAIAQWKLVQYHLNLRGAHSALSLLFALGLWFCTSIVRYWALSIRPDMAAIALVMVALYMVVRQPRFGFAYAGMLFYLAWSFKQSVVLAFAGVCLFLLFHKRWRDLTVLATVFVALIAATLLLGTPEYRFDILVAPRFVREFSISWALQVAPKSMLANAYWILAPIVLLHASGVRRFDNTVRLLIIVLIVALSCGLIGMSRVGGWDNYILEAFVAGSTLLQIAIFTAPGRLASALVLYGCIIPSIQVATKPSGTQMHTFGTVGIATAAEYADAVALRDRLALMKKPILSTDPIFSLPWFSSDNHAPALVIDYLFLAGARARCQNGCVEGMLQRGEIPTVVLQSTGDPYQSSLSPKYEKAGEARESQRMWSIYVLNSRALSSDSPIKK